MMDKYIMWFALLMISSVGSVQVVESAASSVDVLTAMQQQINTMHNQIQKHEKENEELKEIVSELSTKLEAKTADNYIGFHAYHSGEWTDAFFYNVGTVIPFSNVVTNFGSHYDGTSTFTCSVPGIYYFSFSLLGYFGNNEAFVSLTVGGVPVASSQSSSGHTHAIGSSALVECNNVDVLLQTVNPYGRPTSVIHGSTTGSFSGFLVSLL